MSRDFEMLRTSNKLKIRRSWLAVCVLVFVTMQAPNVFAEVGVIEDDVGIVEDTFDADAESDTAEGDVEEVDEDVLDSDADEGDIGEGDVGEGDEDVLDSDVEVQTDAGGEENDAGETEPDFLLVNLQVEVSFNGDAPDVVNLGLTGNLGAVAPEEVQVSGQGVALWELEELQAGAWTLFVAAEGFESVQYRFVAGDSSQMQVRVSMVEFGQVPDVKVESGWACSAVSRDALPSMLVLASAMVGGMLVQRRRRRT